MLDLPTERLYHPDVAKPFTRRLAARLVPADLAWRRPPTDYTAVHDATAGTVRELREALAAARLEAIAAVPGVDALVQQKVMREHLWIPVLNINMDQVANKRISSARPHMLYQNTFYKGLDVTR